MGRERALTAAPSTDPEVVETALDLTTEARQALAIAGSPPLDPVPDVRSLLERAAAPAGTLDGSDLVQFLPLLDAVPRLVAYGRTVRPGAPAIAKLAESLPAVPDLRALLRRSLDDAGDLTDDASPRLGQLRRDIRARRRRIVTALERILHGPDAERLLADRFVTIRNGRYVLPVRAEARGRIRGIVHDRSQSGQTLFVEPDDVVEANNDLVQGLRGEEQESARILAGLTAAVRARAAELAELLDALGGLDWAFARGHTANRMDASRPLIDRQGRVALHAARHPLLLAQSWRDPGRPVVPVDLEIVRHRPILLVTGPNAGGKTIALTTLALLVLMTQVGCHVPTAEGSRLPVFDGLFAVIGDEQSVAENLSTFSAFVAQIRRVLDEADAGSLVLLDELGAGTDPEEGAALAQALLEGLDARGALVVATTHLEPLRAFASTHPRARNASVEFDTATLAPTFRLVYDRPGPSYALAIAARLGLEPELIARARRHRSEHGARLGELLARLDASARAETERAREIERLEREAAARLAAAAEAEAAAAARAHALLDRARAEATALVGDVRRAVNAEWDRLKREERSRRSLDATRHRLQAASARIQPPPSEPAASLSDTPLVPGSPVTAEHLGLRGEIVAIAGEAATVRAGAVTVRVPLHALRPAPAGDRAAAAPAGGRRAPPPAATPAPRAVAPELLLLGRTADEAVDLVEQYLDDAFVAGLPAVRVVHGKGTGALRRAVRALLSAHPLVASFRDGEPSEGGAGATVAALKVS